MRKILSQKENREKTNMKNIPNKKEKMKKQI